MIETAPIKRRQFSKGSRVPIAKIRPTPDQKHARIYDEKQEYDKRTKLYFVDNLGNIKSTTMKQYRPKPKKGRPAKPGPKKKKK